MISVFWILGTALVVFLPYMYLVLLGYVVKGLPLGFIAAIVPLYISETIPSGRKGSSLSAIYSFYGIGASMMTWIAFFLPTVFGAMETFKLASAIEAAPATCLFLLTFILPESPKWLAMHSRWSEASRNLLRIQNYEKRKQKTPTTEIEVSNDKLHVLNAYTTRDRIKACTYSNLFGKRYWKQTFIGVLTQCIVQFTCIEIVMNQFWYISKVCGIVGSYLSILKATNYGLLALFTIFPSLLLDSCRRKDVLVFGLIILGGIYFLIWSILFFYGFPPNPSEKILNSPFYVQVSGEAASLILATFMFLTAIFASIVGPASWLYTSEIFNGPARAKGMGICMGAGLVVHAGTELSFKPLSRLLGPWMFFVLGIFSFGGGIIVMCFPETRDLSDLQVETLFEPFSIEEKTQLIELGDKDIGPIDCEEKLEKVKTQEREECIEHEHFQVRSVASILEKSKLERREKQNDHTTRDPESSEELPMFSEVDLNFVQSKLQVLQSSPVQSMALSEKFATIENSREPSIHTVKESLYTSALSDPKTDFSQNHIPSFESTSIAEVGTFHNYLINTESIHDSDNFFYGSNERSDDSGVGYKNHSYFHSDENKEVKYFPNIVRSKLKRGLFLIQPTEQEKEILKRKQSRASKLK